MTFSADTRRRLLAGAVGSLVVLIGAALLDLSVDYRGVIILRHFVHLSHREMSRVLEIPEKTVKSRLHSARKLLGELLVKRGVSRA